MLELREVTSIQIRPSTCRVFLSSFLSSQYRKLHPTNFGPNLHNDWPQPDLSEGISLAGSGYSIDDQVEKKEAETEPEVAIGMVAEKFPIVEPETVLESESSPEWEDKRTELLANGTLGLVEDAEEAASEGKRVIRDPPQIFWEDPYPLEQRNHNFVQYSNWRLTEGRGGTR